MKRKSLLITLMLCFACFGVANAQTELMTENFDGMSSIATSYSASGWFAYNAGNGNNWTINTSSSYAHSGSNSAQVQYNSSYAANCYLVSAPFTTSPNMTEISVSLYERVRSSSYAETFEVFFVKASDVTTAASVTSATQYNAISSQDYTNATYAEVTGSYTSSALAGQDLRVVVHCTSIADRYYLYIDDITVSDNGVISCPKPANLEVTNDGATATATWEGDATDYNISINGTVTNNVTSPYTFEVETSTTYTVMVEANCTGETSGYCNPVTFTVQCLPQDMCSITLALTDSYGDSWNGGKMEVVDATTGEVYGTYTIASGGSATYELALCPGTVVNFVYTAGSFGTENGWVIYAPNGEVITEEAGCNDGCTHTNGIQATYTMDCSGCFKPSDLEATNIGTTSAELNWTGENDSYVLQYRTAATDMNMGVWEQQGNDIEAPGEFTQLTFDLSDYSGTGYIAIRHYACSGQWQMTIDDIVVTNANNETVFTEDFNSGSIPSSCTNLDYDGDGHLWQIANFGDDAGCQHGAYCLMSASYSSSEGDLNPDNWFIIPNVALGGTLTFYVASTDASWPENFGVFVATSSYEGVPAGAWSSEIPVATTSYDLTGLTANTAYEWQVKGICNDYPDPSNWASSSFTTIPEGFKTFVTEGNWDVANNWYPVGVPAITDEVSIEAPVTIPAGVVATAKKATINGGSVLIKDGGQLKQGSYTLKVTMEKDITGYGESTNDHYYFIATPLTGTTQLGYTSSWNYVTNVNVGDYDFYWFDASAAHEEWQNYKAYSSDFVMNPGEGYLYANKVDKQLQFVGTTKGYNIPTTIDFAFDETSTTPFNGWSLVGNPYSCNAYLSYVDANDVALDADFYTLNNDNTYTLMSSSTPLAPCTGALINYSATGKVQYATEAPTSKGSMLNMTVSEGRGTVDQIRVRFGQGHNLKHMSFRNSSKLYMPVDGNNYAVVYADEMGEMPVNFKAEKNGTYTISFNTENVEFNYLHLIDNMTGNDVDLLNTPSYTFNANYTDYASRFKLVFATGNSSNSETFAYYNDGDLVINNEGAATLQVIDVLGRIISTQNINGSQRVSFNGNGVYMLQLIQGSNVKTQKIVVE